LAISPPFNYRLRQPGHALSLALWIGCVRQASQQIEQIAAWGVLHAPHGAFDHVLRSKSSTNRNLARAAAS
jgi:hypothetical protein